MSKPTFHKLPMHESDEQNNQMILAEMILAWLFLPTNINKWFGVFFTSEEDRKITNNFVKNYLRKHTPYKIGECNNDVVHNTTLNVKVFFYKTKKTETYLDKFLRGQSLNGAIIFDTKDLKYPAKHLENIGYTLNHAPDPVIYLASSQPESISIEGDLVDVGV